MFKIGIIGDLHTHWDDVDVYQFNQTDYDLLFFTGDLGGGTSDSCLQVARRLSRLELPTLVMPGNNDLADIHEFAAELQHRTALQGLEAIRLGSSISSTPPSAIQLCGFSSHRLPSETEACTLIAGRPHSMGGPELSFRDFMRDNYLVGSMADATDLLVSLVDRADTEQLIFCAHNGPTGLGSAPSDPWGCDFRPQAGDWGDPDLRSAIDHARQTGRRVLAVIGGHMHLKTKQGQQRPWRVHQQDTLYINAARVPRIFSSDDVYRHHVLLQLEDDQISATEVLVPEYGD